MIYLLAEGPSLEAAASGQVVIPAWAMLAALLAVVSAFVILGKMLLAEKDSKLTLATTFGKDASADQLARHAILTDLASKVARVAEGLETALDERDKIVVEAMTELRAIRAEVTQLVRQRSP